MVNIPKFSSILVFGDSLVDTGNNNHINTLAKADHFPYGRDFPGHVATGRVSNGKLVPDFLASILNLKDIVPPYLDPNLSDEQLLTGVSFASAGQDIYDLGCRKFGVGGLGPTGCIPYQITIKFGLIRKCVDYENFYCQQYNQKLMKRLPQIQASLARNKIVYTDLYYPVLNLLNQPEKYEISSPKFASE
ncbi:hypothetical protein Fmac_015498 [Flemingia macrophylla]|uniref:GDSL esterase/lipase n=1 Tax=Flemingia macrophylla TaxID=520843 RepID=A0ABD1MER7_9FABA